MSLGVHYFLYTVLYTVPASILVGNGGVGQTRTTAVRFRYFNPDIHRILVSTVCTFSDCRNHFVVAGRAALTADSILSQRFWNLAVLTEP